MGLSLNRKVVWIILCLSLFFVSLLASVQVVKADSNDSIRFSYGVTLLSPVNRTYNSRFLILNYTFLCGFGVGYSLNYSIDGIYGGPMPFVVNNPEEVHVVYSSTGSVVLPELSEGSHSLTITLEAVMNDHDKRSYADTVYFYIDTTATNFTDTTPPSITIQSPQNSTYTTTTLPLNFTINEQPTTITCCLDGNKTTMAAENTTLTGLSTGEHNITITAQDEAGNIGTSDTVQFAITNPTPTPSPPAALAEPSLAKPVAAASVVLAAGFSIGIIAYISIKRRKTSG